MVFYFTGTGNSLYVAKQLEEKPVSIPQVIRNGKLDFTAESIGSVAPVYGHEVPPMGLNVSEKNQNARYINEHIALDEIIEANNQI